MFPIYTNFKQTISGKVFWYRDGDYFVDDVQVTHEDYRAQMEEALAKLPKQESAP